MNDKRHRNCSFLIRPKYPSIESGINEASLVAKILYQWAEDLFLHIDKKDFIDIKFEDANRENIERLLDANPEIPILFYGHGDDEDHSLLGYNNYAVLDTKNNNKRFKSRKILVVACCSEHFADDCIGKGAFYYIGYNGKPFIPTVEDEFVQGCFKEPNNSGALMVIRNNFTMQDINKEMTKTYDNSISKLYNNPTNFVYALFLNSNLQKLITKPELS